MPRIGSLARLLAALAILLFLPNELAPQLMHAQAEPSRPDGFSTFRPRRELPGEPFTGSFECGDCHSQKTHAQQATSMAHALSVPSQSAVLKSHPRLTFQSGAYSYEIVSENSRSLYRVTKGQQTFSEPILYAFGNALIAQTFVFRHNGKLEEGRVSYYAAIDGLDWTIGDAMSAPPTVEEAAGRDIESDEARNCFSCHGTGATANGRLRLDGVITGVTCEACHGPAAAHVAAMNAGSHDLHIFNPKTLSAGALSQEFCGACHRSVDDVAMMPNLGGMSNVRFQPYRLFNSRGHNPDDRHFACTACHDPHVELHTDFSLYDANCTVCHGSAPASAERRTETPAARIKPCPVAKERCVSCHMPKVELPGAHFKFTDHRIRIARSGDPYPY